MDNQPTTACQPPDTLRMVLTQAMTKLQECNGCLSSTLVSVTGDDRPDAGASGAEPSLMQLAYDVREQADMAISHSSDLAGRIG